MATNTPIVLPGADMGYTAEKIRSLLETLNSMLGNASIDDVRDLLSAIEELVSGDDANSIGEQLTTAITNKLDKTIFEEYQNELSDLIKTLETTNGSEARVLDLKTNIENLLKSKVDESTYTNDIESINDDINSVKEDVSVLKNRSFIDFGTVEDKYETIRYSSSGFRYRILTTSAEMNKVPYEQSVLAENENALIVFTTPFNLTNEYDGEETDTSIQYCIIKNYDFAGQYGQAGDYKPIVLHNVAAARLTPGTIYIGKIITPSYELTEPLSQSQFYEVNGEIVASIDLRTISSGNGKHWHSGTGLNHTTGTVDSTIQGISGDMYLNTEHLYVYRCTGESASNPDKCEWAYIGTWVKTNEIDLSDLSDALRALIETGGSVDAEVYKDFEKLRIDISDLNNVVGMSESFSSWEPNDNLVSIVNELRGKDIIDCFNNEDYEITYEELNDRCVAIRNINKNIVAGTYIFSPEKHTTAMEIYSQDGKTSLFYAYPELKPGNLYVLQLYPDSVAPGGSGFIKIIVSIPINSANTAIQNSSGYYVATCDDMNDTVDKIALVEGDFTLKDGTIVFVKFIDGFKVVNDNATLNINDTGAHTIVFNGVDGSYGAYDEGVWITDAGGVLQLMYNATTEQYTYVGDSLYSALANGSFGKNKEYAGLNEIADELTSAKEILGTLEDEKVDKTQYANNEQYGLVRIQPNGGLYFDNSNNLHVRVGSAYGTMTTSSGGTLYLVCATNSEIDDRTNKYKPIVPSNLEYAVQSVAGKYSTTPVQVGTWIDGNPIWRVAFSIPISETDVTNESATFNMGEIVLISSEFKIVNFFGYVMPDSGATDLVVPTKYINCNKVTWDSTQIISMTNNPIVYGYIEFVADKTNLIDKTGVLNEGVSEETMNEG